MVHPSSSVLHILKSPLNFLIILLSLRSAGGGEFIVGLTENLAKENPKAGQFIGLISHVNIFNNALDRKDIKWMSHGCGEDFSRAIFPWSQFINGLVGDVKVEKPALCADREGDVRSGFFQVTTYHEHAPV